MDVCSRTPNRTEPVGDDLRRHGDVRLCSRTNGWTWPPHPFQLLAWLLYVFFAVTGFGVFVPLLPAHWIPAGYICTGVLFLGHLCVHVLAVSVDPADHNVRRKAERGPLPAFDRSKHAHVIENCHCYLCQVDVGSKSKHCSSCNKCVANFDHHCRWLNNCVGSRNYKLFLHSVVSALLGVFLVLVLASYVFIEFFIDPNNLRTDQHFQMRNDSGVWFVFLPVAPLRSAAAVIPGLAAVTMALALLSSVLLCHLLCFHIYLMWNRLSTYEYIVRQRHRLDSRDSRKAGSEKETVAPPALQIFNSSGTLEFTNTQLDVEAEPVRAQPGFLANSRVSSVSNPVVEEAEAPPTFSTAMAHPNRNTQKKRKVRRIPVEVIGEQAPPSAPPPDLSNVGQRLPFPAFSLRAPPGPPGPVQAAAPPAEYHSDSAESLEEIPVALAKLGSTSQRVLSAFPRRPSSLRRSPPPRRPSSLRGPSSPQPRTKRKLTSSRLNKNSVELRFELAPQSPTVFVTRASGGAAESQEEVLIQGQRLAGSRPGPGSRPGSQASLSSGLEPGPPLRPPHRGTSSGPFGTDPPAARGHLSQGPEDPRL